MHLRNRALYAVSPSSNPRVSCLADAPPPPPVAALPIRKATPQQAAPARDLGPSHNWERISATKRCRTPSFSVLRRTQSYRILPAMRCHIACAHAQSRRCSSTSLVGRKSKQRGKRNPEGAVLAVQGAAGVELWGWPASRWNRTRMARERVACLFVEDSRDISHASLPPCMRSPDRRHSQSPARSILARGRLPRSPHRRIRIHAHHGLMVGLFVEQQVLLRVSTSQVAPRTQARFLLSCPVLSCRRNGTKSQPCGGRHRTKIRCWSRLARQ